MKVGIQLPSWGVTAFGAQECLALAQRAEALGFDSLRCCLSEGQLELSEAPERLLAAHDRALAMLVSQRPQEGGFRSQDGIGADEVPVRNRHLIGGPQDITHRLLAYRDVGMQHAVVSFVSATDSFRALDIFAREVMPALKAQVPGTK